MKTFLNESCGSTLTFALSGEVDHHTAKDLRREIDSEILITRPQKIALDFTEVSMMDSSGIGLILGRYETAESVGASVVVTGATGEIGRIIKLSGIERLPNIKVVNEKD